MPSQCKHHIPIIGTASRFPQRCCVAGRAGRIDTRGERYSTAPRKWQASVDVGSRQQLCPIGVIHCASVRVCYSAVNRARPLGSARLEGLVVAPGQRRSHRSPCKHVLHIRRGVDLLIVIIRKSAAGCSSRMPNRVVGGRRIRCDRIRCICSSAPSWGPACPGVTSRLLQRASLRLELSRRLLRRCSLPPSSSRITCLTAVRVARLPAPTVSAYRVLSYGEFLTMKRQQGDLRERAQQPTSLAHPVHAILSDLRPARS
jgi:hypothetical protein